MEPSQFLIKHRRSGLLPAFTLVEMIVVLAIITIITGVVLNGQQNFNKSLIITDTAYTIALSIRQAQTYGLSSRTFGSQTAAKYAYGVHLDASNATTKKSYTVFADISGTAPPSFCQLGTAGQPDAKLGNCLFDVSASPSEVLQQYTFGRGFSISEICGRDAGNPSTIHCSTDLSPVTPVTVIDIVFQRPNTNSVITGFIGGVKTQLSDVRIKLTDSTGTASRKICVSLAGQISVATSTCP
jgi:type II secretory pathway pseudopilin PulG